MTDRINSITIILEENIREDAYCLHDLRIALKQIKGVLEVVVDTDNNVSRPMSEKIGAMRSDELWRKRILKLMDF